MNGHVVAVAARTAEQARRERENLILNSLETSLRLHRKLARRHHTYVANARCMAEDVQKAAAALTQAGAV